MPLQDIIRDIQADLAAECSPALAGGDAAGAGRLVEDLAQLLYKPAQRNPGSDYDYEEMLAEIVRSPRWRLLQGYLRDAQRRVGRHQEEARLAAIAGLVRFVVKSLVYRLANLCAAEAGAAGVTLDGMVAGYNGLDKENNPVLEDHIMVGMALANRSKLPAFLDQWMNREMIEACLKASWDLAKHDIWPRKRIPIDGLLEERVSGDLSGVQGVKIKTREDQLKDIVPPEWLLVFSGDEGLRKRGLQYIMEKPLIYEHHQPNRPIVRNRLLVVVVIGAEARRERKAAVEAQVRARKLAFEWVVTAAMKKPDNVDVDVGWFEQRDGQWVGGEFPIQAIPAQADVRDNWRNLLALDEVLPHFFVRWADGAPAAGRRAGGRLREDPTSFLERNLNRHVHQGVVMAVAMKPEERSLCLPAASVVLPRVDSRVQSVLMATVSETEKGCRGEAMRDLMSAGAAGLWLPPAEEEDLVRTFITMLYGPLATRSSNGVLTA